MTTFPYTTLSGDTFDSIALDFFDDEKYSAEIIKQNPDHAGTIRFSAGVKLMIPSEIESTAETLPPWKR